MYDVFVYGTLMKDQPNHKFLIGSQFISRGLVYGQMYRLWSFPGLKMDTGKEFRPYWGEVYRADDKTLSRLDILEGHPNMYTRTTVKIINESGDLQVCFIYLYNGSVESKNLVLSDSWPNDVNQILAIGA